MLLLMCRNRTDFWIFILYPVTSLNSFILVVFCRLLGIFYVAYHVLCKYGPLYFFLFSFFSSVCFFRFSSLSSPFFFSYLTALARTSSTILHSSDRNGCSCLVHNCLTFLNTKLHDAMERQSVSVKVNQTHSHTDPIHYLCDLRKWFFMSPCFLVSKVEIIISMPWFC